VSRVRIKVCGLTRPEDAEVCDAAGVDAIGVIFAAHSRRVVTLDQAARVTAAVGPFVLRVGVFAGQTEGEILDAVDRVGLDVVQLHGGEDDALTARLQKRVRVVRALTWTASETPAAWRERPHDGILLDGPKPGSGEAFSWTEAAAWRGVPRLLLAGGLHPGNVADAVRAMQPWGVDVASGVEASIGQKDPAKVTEFVAAVRAAEAA